MSFNKIEIVKKPNYHVWGEKTIVLLPCYYLNPINSATEKDIYFPKKDLESRENFI